jgi:hypothetical protein
MRLMPWSARRENRSFRYFHTNRSGREKASRARNSAQMRGPGSARNTLRSSRSRASLPPVRGHAGNGAIGEDLWFTLSRKEIQNVIHRRSVAAALSLED